jgi:CRISPR-associated endonuclease/helicase Cas3
LRDFVKNKAAKGKVFRRDFLEARWIQANAAAIYPAQTVLVHWRAGGYEAGAGWDARAVGPVDPPRDRHARLTTETEEEWEQYEQEIRRFVPDPDDYGDDGLSRTDRWQTIAEHTDLVCTKLDWIIDRLNIDAPLTACLQQAARWHDWGKAHDVFQGAVAEDGRPISWAGCRVVAKAPGSRRDQHGKVVEKGFWRRYRRKHFRHELASALGVLHLEALHTADQDRTLLGYFKSARLVEEDADPSTWQAARNLIAYLIAAHHGKVRLSIRSFPNETKPRDKDGRPQAQKRFARGVWDGDVLSQTDLGGDVISPGVTLSLEPMELGLCELPPFAGQPSWLDRMVQLRDGLGPFRLAFLEALLRAADMRASAAAGATSDASASDLAFARTECGDA